MGSRAKGRRCRLCRRRYGRCVWWRGRGSVVCRGLRAFGLVLLLGSRLQLCVIHWLSLLPFQRRMIVKSNLNVVISKRYPNPLIGVTLIPNARRNDCNYRFQFRTPNRKLRRSLRVKWSHSDRLLSGDTVHNSTTLPAKMKTNERHDVTLT